MARHLDGAENGAEWQGAGGACRGPVLIDVSEMHGEFRSSVIGYGRIIPGGAHHSRFGARTRIRLHQDLIPEKAHLIPNRNRRLKRTRESRESEFRAILYGAYAPL